MHETLSSLDECKTRLREWAYFFRDRARKSRTWSAEGNWRSPQVWESPAPRPDYNPRQAVQTWEILKAIPSPYYRALTWRYCYPYLALGIPIRSLSRRLGRKINAKEYDHLVLMGEMAVAAAIYKSEESGYKPSLSGLGRASIPDWGGRRIAI